MHFCVEHETSQAKNLLLELESGQLVPLSGGPSPSFIDMSIQFTLRIILTLYTVGNLIY